MSETSPGIKIEESAHTSTKILGVNIVSTTLSQVLRRINQICQYSLKKPFFITTVNPEIVMLANDNPKYKSILNSADLPLPDGHGLKLAVSRLTVVPGRRLVQELTTKNYKIFYLGGRDKVGSKMVEKFGGVADGGETDIHHPVRNQQIVDKINNYQPDILLVAYGAPYQEQWIYNNREKLKTKVVIGVGGALDYLTGITKLPPAWLSSVGLEWLWRLLHEPWRWRRQLNLFRFAWKVKFT